jgi:Protein kinase domain/PEGA domain
MVEGAAFRCYDDFAFLRSLPLHKEAAGSTLPAAFGHFRVLQQVGAGALGPVFRAQATSSTGTDRFVAIKAFKLDLPPERVHQFVAELERVVAAGLKRAGIAAPLAAGIEENTPYLVQEFVAADSLDVLVRDYGPAPPADAVQVAVQLAGALDYAAVVNVVHGTLHPRDLLLSSDQSRMTGLGVTRALERVGVTPPVRRPYTAPERIAGGTWDRRADIYSLAAIVYEMLWGRRVQGAGSHAVAGLTEVQGADLASLRATFARALAEKPEGRFDTALEFAAALKQGFPGVVEGRDAGRILLNPADTGRVLSDPARETPSDLELIRTAENARYRDVESGPAIIAPGVVPALSTSIRTSGAVLGLHESSAAESALDRTRSALWPLGLALIVGLALGFAAGYGVGNRERAVATVASPAGAAPATEAQPTPSAQPAPTIGRDFTESSVPEPSKPVPPAVATAESAHTVQPANGTRAAAAATSGSRSGAAESGRLLVRSTPAGARVFVDGRERGRTPATVQDLARGSHRVRVVQDGYTPQERRVTVTRSQPSQSISVALTRARPEPPPTKTASAAASRAPAETPRRSSGESFSGALSVDSRPAGAKVFLDGKLAGTTPLALAQVGAGEHVVRIEHDGYRKWSSSVRVVAGERNRVTASLEK